MATERGDMTRRDLLRYAGASATTIATSLLLNYDRPEHLDIQANWYTGLTDFTYYSSEFRFPKPKNPNRKNIQGSIINIPFTPYDDNPNTAKVVADSLDMGITNWRVFTKDYEPEVGEYNERMMNQLKNFMYDVADLSEGSIHFIISGYDTFNFQHSDKSNPVYGPVAVHDPYLFGAQSPQEILENQLRFYTDEGVHELFISRLENIVRSLADVPGFAALEFANEPQIPIQTNDPVGDLTAWYAKPINRIRQINDEIAIIGGHQYPWMINADEVDLDYNSAHLYQIGWGNEVSRLKSYLNEAEHSSEPAVLVTEMGVPQRLGRFLPHFTLPAAIHDFLLSSGIANLVKDTSDIDPANKKLGLNVAGVGIWQLETNEKSRDGFQVNPTRHPRTVRTLHDYNTIVKNAFYMDRI